jgi:hypothetical protein
MITLLCYFYFCLHGVPCVKFLDSIKMPAIHALGLCCLLLRGGPLYLPGEPLPARGDSLPSTATKEVGFSLLAAVTARAYGRDNV